MAASQAAGTSSILVFRTMKKIVVASKNSVKIEAARLAFERVFPDETFACQGVSAASGVSDQPMSDIETYTGAMNRVQAARGTEPDADFYIAFEGGLEERDGAMEVFAWVVIESSTGVFGRGRSATYFLPETIAAHVRSGMELGAADDLVFGRTNSKEQNGSVGILTGDLITRTAYYVEAATLALIPFRNPDLY